MLIVYRKEFRHVSLAAGGDRVVGFMPIPPAGSLRNVWGQIHIIAGQVPVEEAMLLPVRGYVVDMIDLFELFELTQDQLWDAYIPKDVDISAIAGASDVDINTEGTVSGPFEEPGETNPNALFGWDEPSKMIYNRERLLTFSNSPLGFESATPDTYHPAENYSIRVGKRRGLPIFANTGGFVAFAVGSPTWDDVTTTLPRGIGPPGADAKQIMAYSHLPTMLELAKPDLLGLTETGAESPYSDIVLLIEDLTEPTVYEETAARFHEATVDIFARFTFEISVPEEKGANVLSSG